MKPTADIVLVTTGPRGQRCGESHASAKHPNATITRARELRAEGLTYRAIGTALGVNFVTVWYWLTGRRRRPHAKVVARRATEGESAAKRALARLPEQPSNPVRERPRQSPESIAVEEDRDA